MSSHIDTLRAAFTGIADTVKMCVVMLELEGARGA